MNPVDTLFVLICAAMVLLLTPAPAVFYTGLCRRKSGVDIMCRYRSASTWWGCSGP